MLLYTIALAATSLLGANDAKPAHVGEALRAGCSVRQVHTPAGKTVQASPIVRCSPKARLALAQKKAAEAIGASR